MTEEEANALGREAATLANSIPKEEGQAIDAVVTAIDNAAGVIQTKDGMRALQLVLTSIVIMVSLDVEERFPS